MRNIRNTWNIALFMHLFVFHIAAVFRNILLMRNIRSSSTSGMFRMFRMFRFPRGYGQIARPGIFEPRPPVAPERVITLAQLLGLDAVRLEQAGQPPRIQLLAAQRAPRRLFHRVQGFEQLGRGESISSPIVEYALNVAEEPHS